MGNHEDFEKASEEVKTLSTRPKDAELLELYALYKQGREGDVTGSRPGFLDLKGRAKFDAWSKKKGMDKAAAREAYIALARELKSRNG